VPFEDVPGGAKFIFLDDQPLQLIRDRLHKTTVLVYPCLNMVAGRLRLDQAESHKPEAARSRSRPRARPCEFYASGQEVKRGNCEWR
jgi:hypothetical protein